MKKKIVTLSLVVALAATALIGGTLAYFTDDDSATNTFTVGNVEIDLVEPGWTDGGENSGENQAKEVYPGEALPKDPKVINKGVNPCFVRIKVEGLDCLGEGLDIDIRTNYARGEYNDEDWELYGDYYYYKGVLAVGEETTALFDSIVIPEELTNDDHDKNITKSIIVKAEAVQAQGARPSFTAVEAMSVSDIAAWFGECMK